MLEMGERVSSSKYKRWILFSVLILSVSASGCDLVKTVKEYFQEPSETAKGEAVSSKKGAPSTTSKGASPKGLVSMTPNTLARVGNWSITIGEFQERLDALQEVVPEYDTTNPEAKRLVLEELINNLSDNGQTVIFSTHIMEHAERLCDQILLIAGGRKIFDGTVTEARSLIPRRVLLETASDITGLQNLDAVVKITASENEPGADPRWLVEISNRSHPQDILKFCFDQGIPLNRFEFAEPSLHDVFVDLVGNTSREPESR